MTIDHGETHLRVNRVDNPGMTRASRWPKQFAPLTLGLALWAGLPSLEWCPFSWDACGKSCEVEDAAPACAMAVACGTRVADACGAKAPLLPCDPVPDAVPFGDRAWCIHPPIEGVPVRGIELASFHAEPILAVIVEAPRLPPPAGAVRERLERRTTCPALNAPHAPPQSRAPPLT